MWGLENIAMWNVTTAEKHYNAATWTVVLLSLDTVDSMYALAFWVQSFCCVTLGALCGMGTKNCFSHWWWDRGQLNVHKVLFHSIPSTSHYERAHVNHKMFMDFVSCNGIWGIIAQG